MRRVLLRRPRRPRRGGRAIARRLAELWARHRLAAPISAENHLQLLEVKTRLTSGTLDVPLLDCACDNVRAGMRHTRLPETKTGHGRDDGASNGAARKEKYV